MIADLTGPPLHAALEGGVELLRLSADELVGERYDAGDSRQAIAPAPGGCALRARAAWSSRARRRRPC